MRNDELVINSYLWAGLFLFLNLTLKKPTSHTLSIAIILNQLINRIFIQPYRIIYFCFDLIEKSVFSFLFFWYIT